MIAVRPERPAVSGIIDVPKLGDLRVAHFDICGIAPYVGSFLETSPRAIHAALRHLERFMQPVLRRGLVVLPTNVGQQNIEISANVPPRMQGHGLRSWPEWRATISTQFHAGALSAREVAQALGYAGVLVGIGAQCPALGGSYGMFEVVAGNEYELVAS